MGLGAGRAGDQAALAGLPGTGCLSVVPPSQQTPRFSPRPLVLSAPGPVTGASLTAAVCIPDDTAGGGAWAGVTGVLLRRPPPPQPLRLAGCGGVLGAGARSGQLALLPASCFPSCLLCRLRRVCQGPPQRSEVPKTAVEQWAAARGVWAAFQVWLMALAGGPSFPSRPSGPARH